MRKGIKMLLYSSLLAVASTAAISSTPRVNADASGTSASSTATVTFTGGVSLVAVPNFDFGGDNPVNYSTAPLPLYSAETGTPYGRSLIVRNDGGYQDYSVKVSYDSLQYSSGPKIGTSMLYLNPHNINFNYNSGSDLTSGWTPIGGSSSPISTGTTGNITLSDYSTTPITPNSTPVTILNTSTIPSGYPTGAVQVDFPSKNSASLTVGSSDQQPGIAKAKMTWTLSADPTS